MSQKTCAKRYATKQSIMSVNRKIDRACENLNILTRRNPDDPLLPKMRKALATLKNREVKLTNTLLAIPYGKQPSIRDDTPVGFSGTAYVPHIPTTTKDKP